MSDGTAALRQEMRDARCQRVDRTYDAKTTLLDDLAGVVARRVERERDPHVQVALRERDRQYEHRAPERAAGVRRLRLADGLPPELGGRRAAHPDARRAAAVAARKHLADLGLGSELTDRVLREGWRDAS